ncbi:MAG TPA: peptide deformylase [Deltaproteobacteria bacterium]|nr:MAG: peptide deformylase [Deltaproteobacteria bacterium GWA2_55_82]OGQ62273.1 MAG: peptide deformylase [Deltaproteobacteria bacterium RIFCSPLOWO2_02_FULL_55_12]OIJ74385.1 MAG: peptide deformylase [Deltaproteobacteria bacterium GWC2_55_46]HBG47034.1 peptide deformylase [Deltaproteobacteria bacterium]HCY10906.1 peptide deformylase [Deltaproteobacteria bacterium]
MILNILKYPDPFLKTKATPVDKVDDGIRKLIDDMVETMYVAKGIGLASVQVGVDKRVIVLDVPGEEENERVKGKNLVALVNPEIVSAEGETVYEEGCLSVPGFTADVERASRLKVRALDRDGKPVEIKAGGLFAIALQHEIDHIDGILFIDRLSRLKREMIKRKLKKALEAEERAL